jgi:hypothetical protein
MGWRAVESGERAHACPSGCRSVPPENLFGEQSEPRCGNVPLMRTLNTPGGEALDGSEAESKLLFRALD